MRYVTFSLAVLALALTACVSGITKHGVLLDVGPEAEADHAAMIADKTERGVPESDFLGSLLEIAAYVALGGAGAYGGYKGVGKIASITPWSKDEIKDIQNPTTLTPKG